MRSAYDPDLLRSLVLIVGSLVVTFTSWLLNFVASVLFEGISTPRSFKLLEKSPKGASGSLGVLCAALTIFLGGALCGLLRAWG